MSNVTFHPTVQAGKAAAEFLGKDVVPLHAIDTPLVKQMQDVIRQQHAQLERCCEAIDYLLSPDNRNHDKLQSILYMTEAQERLMKVMAEITGIERGKICDYYDAHFMPEEEEA